MKRQTKSLTGIISLCIVVVVTASLFGGDTNDDALKTDLKMARAENEMLKSNLAAKTKELESLQAKLTDLQAKVASLTKVIESSGIDTGSGDAPSGSDTPTATTKVAKDPNVAVCAAFYKFTGAVEAVVKNDKTDIQKRTAWLAAARELDSVLKKSRVIITYTIQDVNLDSKGKAVELTVSSACIKSSDSSIADLTLGNVRGVRIISTPEMAMKITKDSKLTVEGGITTNINFSKPVSEQPSFFFGGLGMGYETMEGFRAVGTPKTAQQENVNVYFPKSGRFLAVTPTIMIQNNCMTKVDGIARVRAEDSGIPGHPKRTH